MGKSDLVGVQGLLLLLVVMLILIGPVTLLGGLSNEFEAAERQLPALVAQRQWVLYKNACWLIAAVASVISITAGLRLWALHVPESPRFAVIALWIVTAGTAVGFAVALVFAFGAQAFQVTHELASTVISSMLIALIWTLYLRFSRRVRNTYRLRASIMPPADAAP